MKFSEGEEYSLDELPENEMQHSGRLEAVGDGKVALLHNGDYITFEWSKVRCLDVTAKEEI